MITIPVTADAAQKFATQLGLEKLVFDIQWNDRTSLFSLTLTNEDTQQVYFYGVPLVLGANLFEPYNYKLGALIVVDTSNQHLETTIEEFGDRVQLIWFSEEEVVNAIG